MDGAVFVQPEALVGVEGAVVGDGAPAGEVDLDGVHLGFLGKADVSGWGVLAALATGCRSVAFTYNDPVIWAEYAIDIAREARRRGGARGG